MTEQESKGNPIQPTDLEKELKPIQLQNGLKYFRPPVTSRELGKMEPDKLDDAAYEIQGWISDYCGYLAELLYFDPKLQENLFARLQEARKDIKNSMAEDLEGALNDAIFTVHRVHASIAREQELEKKRGSLGVGFITLSLVYIAVIIGIIVYGNNSCNWLQKTVIGIPISVLLWSFLGSLAAILYRFYNSRLSDLSQVSVELNWLIARPLIGVIMGMLSFVIISAGLLVFGPATQPGNDPSIRPQLLWAVAFLAGFSDKFYLGFIDSLVGKFSGTGSKSPPN